MGLNLPGVKQIFSHSASVDTGVGKVRIGQATFTVALDGTGDVDSIQEGIDLLPSTGGVVYIKEGTYTIKKLITINVSNTSIIGAGSSTIIIAKTTKALVAKTLTNITIENIKFIGANSVITNNTMVEYDDTTDSIVRGCWFEDAGQEAVRILGSADNCIVNNNVFNSNAHNAITITSNKITVIGNIIRDGAKNGITTAGSADNILIGNLISGNTEDGILLNSTTDNNIIVGNRLTGNGQFGIDINNANCDKNILIGNICLGNTTGAINDSGTNTHPNGASGTTNLALDDLNIIA